MPEKEPDKSAAAIVKQRQGAEAAFKEFQKTQEILAKFSMSEAVLRYIQDSSAKVIPLGEWVRSMDAMHGLASGGALRAGGLASVAGLSPSQKDLEEKIYELRPLHNSLFPALT